MKCTICNQNDQREPIVHLPNIVSDLRRRSEAVRGLRRPNADNDRAHPSCVTTLLEQIVRKEERRGIKS